MELKSVTAHDAVLSSFAVVWMVRRCHDNWCRSLVVRCWSSSEAAQWSSGRKNSTDDSR